MNEPKTFASLSPTLLARKGGAKPAMRPQLTPINHFAEQGEDDHDDLGWNDMGHEPEESAAAASGAQVVQFQPDPAPVPTPPAVVRQQHDLARRVAATVDRRPALADGRRTAFTLRLDSERHLKLRLACTVKGRSAQQLVTEALDHLLGGLPDLADIAERVGRSKR